MEKRFDYSDPTDQRILICWLNGFSEEKWQALIDYTYEEQNKRNFKYEERKVLALVKKFLNKDDLSFPQFKSANWAYNIVQRIESLDETAETRSREYSSGIKGINSPLKHVTFRVAWHDLNWNGSVCKCPDKNIFCSGYHSLLSDRIRRNKEKLLDLELKYAGESVSKMIAETGKFPPCYWSINIFGETSLDVNHENPAAPSLAHIEEKLPAFSIFSWPFAISFVRSNEEFKENGKYPANLEKWRIPRFKSRIKPEESIGIIYAKFSNPISYEEMKYLVIACGKISEVGDNTYFGPKEEIERIRNRKRELRNFPSINWATRFSFDPDSMVRVPYFEYQEEAKRRNLDAESTDRLLQKISVTIDEPELEHCFKYVAMDVDDDEAIFILTKIRAKLLDSKTDGILELDWIQDQLSRIEDLLEYCWNRRTHFPGFGILARILLDKQETEDCKFDKFVINLKETEPDYCDTIRKLIEDPKSIRGYAHFESDLIQLRKILMQIGLSVDQFLLLSMLNLTPRQFEKINKGLISSSDETINEVCNNPYLLFEEYIVDKDPQDPVSGDFIDRPVELFKIDIALFPNTDYLGINFLQKDLSLTDPRRIRALIIQYLRSLENKTGDCFDNAENIEEYLREFPLFYKSSHASLTLPNRFLTKSDVDFDRHLSIKLKIKYSHDKKFYYLNEIFEAENEIGDFIKILLQSAETNQLSFENIDQYLSTSCQKLGKKIGTSFDSEAFVEERTKLYRNLFPRRFFVLCGTPGSGKSYEILNIIDYFNKNDETYLLLAPTGKAVLRLKFDEAYKDTQIEAMTIDKFIYQFKHHPHKRKKYNNVIVDESSMVDLIKFRDLLRCFVSDDPGLFRLILVGDIHQLPPIGFGKPFFDIIQYLKSDSLLSDHFIELDVNCRQELSENAILDLCKLFINEADLSDDQVEKLSAGGTISKGFKVRYWESEEKLDGLLAEEWLNLSKQLKYKGSYEAQLDQLFEIELNVEKAEDIQYDMERFQVISPYRYFADKINLYFQSKVRTSHEIEILKLFKPGDKIIRTKNYYTKDGLVLSNGSIGLAAMLKNDKILCFPELKEKYINTYGENGIRESEKDFFELAYGITVHKAQGSGFEHLIVILPKRYGLLCKELFYTALSRSKKDITILIEGESGVDFEDSLFEYARKRTFTENRKTSLLLDNPYRSYGLEPEKNVFVQSREEQIIYRHLMDFRSKYSETDGFYFEYEKFPIVDDKKIRIKTDFTIYTKKGIFYWEHLGMLTKKSYKKTWLNLKRPTYEKAGLLEKLITTDNLNGISDDKIITIIQSILDNNVGNEDRTRLYSIHHFSLR